MYKIQVGQITRFNLANKRTTEQFQKAAKLKYIHSTPKEKKKIKNERKIRNYACVLKESVQKL